MKYLKVVIALPYIIVYFIGNLFCEVGSLFNKAGNALHYICDFIDHEIASFIDRKKTKKKKEMLELLNNVDLGGLEVRGVLSIKKVMNIIERL